MGTYCDNSSQNLRKKYIPQLSRRQDKFNVLDKISSLEKELAELRQHITLDYGKCK